MRRLLVLLLVLVVTGPVAGCDRPPPLDHLVIAAGSPGDNYLDLGTSMAGVARHRWSVGATVLRTGGSTDNLRLVASGQADVGFATVDTALDAIDGEPPFNGSVPLVALAGLYDDYLHIVVRADSPIRTLAELTGRRLGTGPDGSVSAIVMGRLLPGIVDGVTTIPMPPDALPAALVAGSIDAFALTGALPLPTVDELARRVPIRLIPTGAGRAELQQRFSEQYLSRSIPVGLYAQVVEVDTVGVHNVVVVRRDLPDSVARAITELVQAAINPRAPLATYPLALHPGAVSYYRDAKSLV